MNINTNNSAESIYVVPADSVREFTTVDAAVCNKEFAIHCALALIGTDTMAAAQVDNKKAATGSLSAYLFNRVCRSDFPVAALSEFRTSILESAKAGNMAVRYKQDKKGRDTKELADPEALKSLFSMCRSITASPYRSEALKETGLRKAYDACRNLEQSAKFREASERAQKEQIEAAKRQQELADEQAEVAEVAKAESIRSGEYAKTLAQRVTEARKAYESQIQAIREEAYCLAILDALDAELGETLTDDTEAFDAEGERVAEQVSGMRAALNELNLHANAEILANTGPTQGCVTVSATKSSKKKKNAKESVAA